MALTTLEEVAEKADRTMVERDGAILRLIYTFEAVWKACQQLLAEREGIEVASSNATIRAARRLGWLSDEDAVAAIVIGRDRNLAVRMYRGEIGAEIAERLAGHAALAAPLAGRVAVSARPVTVEETSFLSRRVRS